MEAILAGDGRQGNNRLRTPKRLFAPTQTTLRAYANDCSPIRKLNSRFCYRGCKEGAYFFQGVHPTQSPIPIGFEGKRGAGCRVQGFFDFKYWYSCTIVVQIA